MKGSSRASFASARASLDKHLQGANNAQATALSSELFLTLHALDSSIALRRGLTDPSRSGQDKVSLVDQLVSKHIGPATVELLHLMVASRWSSPIDLSDAIEWLAVEAQAAAADADGTLDRLEEELFRFGSIVAANPELRSTLANRTTTTGVFLFVMSMVFRFLYLSILLFMEIGNAHIVTTRCIFVLSLLRDKLICNIFNYFLFFCF